MAESFQLFHALPDDAVSSLGIGVAWGSRNSSPLGPFTGYAAILKHSTFLNPAQQLLSDIFRSGHRIPIAPLVSAGDEGFDRFVYGFRNNSRLVLMLEEVNKRCKLYCQQIQSVVSSFETVAGVANSAPFICHAIRAISVNFYRLKNVILSRFRFAAETKSRVLDDGGISRAFWETNKTDDHIHDRLTLKYLSSALRPSHRGLPEHAVAVLKKWLFEHFLHPYPSDLEKQLLAQRTGLSRNQVTNWFINSRVRLWKPMIEEMHDLEVHKSHSHALRESSTSTNKRSRNNGVRFLGNASVNSTSETSASLALDLQPSIGLGPSLAFSRPMTHTFDFVSSGEAGFKNWF